MLRHQSRTLRITEESFVEELAPARTFTFLKDVEMLRQNGLALGGSLDNALVLGETGVHTEAPSQVPGEPRAWRLGGWRADAAVLPLAAALKGTAPRLAN